MAFDVNNIVINRPLRGIATNSSGDIVFTLSQIKDPTLTMSSETVQAMDAMDIPIMEFDRSKSCEFSATQSVFDLALLAAQGGTTKKYASANNNIRVPMWETVTVGTTDATVTLKRTPINTATDCSIPYIWELKSDKSLSTRYSLDDSAASATEFTLSGTTLTLPTGATATRTFLIPYEYFATGADNLGAVEVRSSADVFNVASKFVLQCLGHNVCDPTTEIAVWLIFDNAKLTSDFDLTLSPEMAQAFTLKVMSAYCETDRPLFKMVIPENPAA